MIYIIANKYGSCSEIRNFNKIRFKASKRTSVSSSDDSDSDSSLASDIRWETYRRPAWRKEINKLDHVVTENLKNYQDHSNEAINSDPTFDKSSFNLSSGTNNPLPVVNVYLQGVNTHIETTFYGLTCLWESGATNIMIKRLHTKNYERKIRSNKVEYSTTAGVYFATHDIKVPFCMP